MKNRVCRFGLREALRIYSYSVIGGVVLIFYTWILSEKIVLAEQLRNYPALFLFISVLFAMVYGITNTILHFDRIVGCGATRKEAANAIYLINFAFSALVLLTLQGLSFVPFFTKLEVTGGLLAALFIIGSAVSPLLGMVVLKFGRAGYIAMIMLVAVGSAIGGVFTGFTGNLLTGKGYTVTGSVWMIAGAFILAVVCYVIFTAVTRKRTVV